MLPASPGQQEQAASTRRSSAAKKDEIVGPVKTPVGYYVFEVTKVTPASRSSAQGAKASIKPIAPPAAASRRR